MTRLVRLRADPDKVRVGVRRLRTGRWLVTIRSGLFQIAYAADSPDVAVQLALDKAIELAHRYASEVLDNASATLTPRPER